MKSRTEDGKTGGAKRAKGGSIGSVGIGLAGLGILFMFFESKGNGAALMGGLFLAGGAILALAGAGAKAISGKDSAEPEAAAGGEGADKDGALASGKPMEPKDGSEG